MTEVLGGSVERVSSSFEVEFTVETRFCAFFRFLLAIF